VPVLENARHERFAQELANGKSAAEAYVLAGYKGNSGNACTLKAYPSIPKRVKEILEARERKHEKSTEKAIEKLALTREWVLARLIENATAAADKKDFSPANRALELLGKEIGMFIDRKESGAPGDFAQLDAAGVRAAIAERLGLAIPGNGPSEPAGKPGSVRGESNSVH
jgi:phage terminase small subunit